MKRNHLRQAVTSWVFLSSAFLFWVLFSFDLYHYMKDHGLTLGVFFVYGYMLLVLMVHKSEWYKDLFDKTQDTDVFIA